MWWNTMVNVGGWTWLALMGALLVLLVCLGLTGCGGGPERPGCRGGPVDETPSGEQQAQDAGLGSLLPTEAVEPQEEMDRRPRCDQ